ncbi:hypothetical protein, partial [Clostridium perfringens]|uniref:hypothetical protein n=1 Tax=Clostridium perfringens TaxID=1502 RepID=UPI002ACC18EF
MNRNYFNVFFTKKIKINRLIKPDVAQTINNSLYPISCKTSPRIIDPNPIPKSKAVKNVALATPIFSGLANLR